MAATGEVALVVSVEDDHLDRLGEVAAALRRAGMRVERSLPALGTITGSAPLGRVDALRATSGVAAVERGREYRLAPPDAPVQLRDSDTVPACRAVVRRVDRPHRSFGRSAMSSTVRDRHRPAQCSAL